MHFPICLQRESSDCGPACLQMISLFYDKKFSQLTLKENCNLSRNGVSLLSISETAEKLGFRTIGTHITWEQLCNEARLPCIAHWNQRHFIVVYKIRKKLFSNEYDVIVGDPACGLIHYTKDQFCNNWLCENATAEQSSGIALLLEPTPAFYSVTDTESSQSFDYRFLIKYLKPFKSHYFKILVALLLSLLINTILPFFTQSIVDVGIASKDIKYIILVLFAQLMLALGQMANNLTKNWIMLHMTIRINLDIITDFLQKLMQLPIYFFENRVVGDIMQRVGDTGRIQTFLTGSLVSVIMALISFCVYGCIMGGYNIGILSVFISCSFIYIFWILLFVRKRRILDYMRFQESAVNQSNIVQMISCMQDIKLNNCERQKRWEWERIQAKLYKINIKSLSLGQIQEVGATFIEQTKNIIMSFIAARLVVSGEMTLGMMMALQYIIGQLNVPLSSFIHFVQSLQDAKMSMERIGEIHEKEEEEIVSDLKITEVPHDAQIEFKNVSFSYRKGNTDLVLDDISFTIPTKKITAIVGTSGSGKSTILKLILGFYKPVEGNVFLDGHPLDNYSIRSWREQCGVVMQEGNMFSDSILNNIGVCDQVPNIEKVRNAAKMAGIMEFIETLPHQLNTRIGANGQSLSVGQKQRVLIARAIYKNASYLLLDEATNSLDAINEKHVMENLYNLFTNRTVIIVAHRLSTIKNADKIIVLDKSKIIEQGTHRELMDLKGAYYELVQNQLA
ncbi:peptidase domain-containing ABC transporter [Methanobrevibacter sp.]|uniref:peptidase domain-containing ABC transporter n=1 Tax=Methanobrevibacter sp. TaxID=66852 RepID=UPI00388FD2D9